MQTFGIKKNPWIFSGKKNDDFRKVFLKSKQVFGSLYGPPIKKLPGNSSILIFNYFAGLEVSGSDGGKNIIPNDFPYLETFTNKKLNYDLSH